MNNESRLITPVLIGLSIPAIWLIIAGMFIVEAPRCFYVGMLSTLFGGVLSTLLALQSDSQTRQSVFVKVIRALCVVVIPLIALAGGLIFANASVSAPTTSNGLPNGVIHDEVLWDPSALRAIYFTRGAQQHGWGLLPITETEVTYDLTKSYAGPIVYGKTNYAKLGGQRLVVHQPLFQSSGHQSIDLKVGEHGTWRAVYGKEQTFGLCEDAGALFVKGDARKLATRPLQLYFSVESPDPTPKNGLRIATTRIVKATDEFIPWGILPHPYQWELYIRFSLPNGGIIGDKRMGECPATIKIGADSFIHGSTVYETASYGHNQSGGLLIQPPNVSDFVRITVILLIRPADTKH